MISTPSKAKIFELIFSATNAFKFVNNKDRGIIPFLNEIWDLKSMPSEDRRFQNAEQDIIQHTINNNDWDLQELFKVRLNLLESEEKFIKFLEVFLLPKYQNSPEDTRELTDKINNIIKKEEIILATIGYEKGFPIFEFTKTNSLYRPSDIPANKIPFFVLPYPGSRVSAVVEAMEIDHEKPSQHFVLVADNWDDYTYKTTFTLIYFDNGKKIIIGVLKIGTTIGSTTQESIPNEFFTLDYNFVSLGQSEIYYKTLNETFGTMIYSVLYSLKDAAFFTDISEQHEVSEFFKNSLIRDDTAERLLRTAKPVIQEMDLEDLYSFDYQFCPKYTDTPVSVPFEFSPYGYLPKRIVTLIGKNGVGKTQLLTTLPHDIANENSGRLTPNKPMYSKVIAVSYSTFDNFDIPKKTSEFNYVYCGLRDDSGNITKEQDQLQKFHNTWKKIEQLGRLEKWKKVISNILDEKLINYFIKPSPNNENELYFDKNGFKKARESLSSGQSIVLFVVSEIVANIRLDSLLLFDEPETHLHPNAISQLMNGIAELANEFESYCIIATHSPIIIQEMFSRDVLIMSREADILSVKKIGVESFGENLSVITEEIFGNRAIPKFYEKTIKKLVKRHKNYNKVLEILKEGNLPLSLNVRLYLQSLVDENA